MAQNNGTLIGAAIRPNDSLDAIATFFSNEGKGGNHSYPTLAQVFAIIEPRRDWAMKADVYNDPDPLKNGTYRLVYNKVSQIITDNGNWDLLKSSAATVMDTTYAQLMQLRAQGTLQPGTWYKFTFQTIHTIPNSSPFENFTGQSETLLIQAVSSGKLHGSTVKSVEYPQDTIVYDETKTLTEDNSQARPGMITYRRDNERNVTCYYDFRNVTFRRWQATSYLEAGRVAVSPNSYRRNNDALQVSVDPAYYEDFKTFPNYISVQNVQIGKVSSGNPYNNIVFKNSAQNTIIAGNGRNCTFSNVVDSSIGANLLNCFFNTVTRCQIGTNCQNSNLVNFQDCRVGNFFTNNALDQIFSSTIGNNFQRNGVYYLDETDPENVVEINSGLISGCTFGDRTQNNRFTETIFECALTASFLICRSLSQIRLTNAALLFPSGATLYSLQQTDINPLNADLAIRPVFLIESATIAGTHVLGLTAYCNLIIPEGGATATISEIVDYGIVLAAYMQFKFYVGAGKTVTFTNTVNIKTAGGADLVLDGSKGDYAIFQLRPLPDGFYYFFQIQAENY